MFKLVNGVEVLLSQEEIDEIVAREAIHEQKVAADSLVIYKLLRQKEYPSLNELLVAMIEKEEGRPQALEALMIVREQVKLKYPKPV